MSDDWTHYGTHAAATAAMEMRKRGKRPYFELGSLHMHFDLLPHAVKQSWQTLHDDGWRWYMCCADKSTGEILRFVSKSRRFNNIWKNRNHGHFPWEIFIFIKIS